MFPAALRSLCWLTTGLAGVATAVATTADRRTPAPRAATAAVAPAPHVAGDDHNPRVEPGKVKWHKSFADAQAAAEKSGKPVLLFHMMGQLDRQFC